MRSEALWRGILLPPYKACHVLLREQVEHWPGLKDSAITVRRRGWKKPTKDTVLAGACRWAPTAFLPELTCPVVIPIFVTAIGQPLLALEDWVLSVPEGSSASSAQLPARVISRQGLKECTMEGRKLKEKYYFGISLVLGKYRWRNLKYHKRVRKWWQWWSQLSFYLVLTGTSFFALQLHGQK